MGKITDISSQKNNKRVNIFIDGSFACGLEKITLLNERLKIGDEIQIEELSAIQLKSESATAFDKAVKYLSIRRRTQTEIFRYLKGKGYLDEVINSVTDKLIEYRYVDDEDFTRAYISTYKNKSGKIKLRYDLRRLGVAEEIISDALTERGDESAEAVALAEKYYRTHDKADRNKLYTYLSGKGFTYDAIKEATAVVLSYANQEDEENYEE